ncbi:hypothetical protein [Enterobacter hormaechei]
MKVTLYKINEATNVINKNPVAIKEIDIRMRGLIDSINPVIVLRGSEFKTDYNYLKMSGVQDRFYFVREIESLGGDLFQWRLELDVLETYKNDIINSNMRYRRNLKTGDYVASGFDEATTTTVKKINSDKELPEGSTMIMTSVGGV